MRAFNTFQLIGISLSALFAALSLAAVLRKQVGVRSGGAWILVWVAAVLSIAYPGITVFVARRLGISRGADLVFYFAIIGMLAGFFTVYARLRRLERGITVLVQRLALTEAPAITPRSTDEAGQSPASDDAP